MRQPSRHITDALTCTDYFHGPSPGAGGQVGFKEWQHFLIHTPRTRLLVNFSLMSESWSAAPEVPQMVARVIILAWRERWEGDVDRFSRSQVDVQPGRIDIHFGDNALRFEGGRFLLSVALRQQAVSAELELVPMSSPLAALGRPLARGLNLSWVAVSRLLASGTITVNGRSEWVSSAPAYHDHNWGHFSWGDDFAWEWGSALPWSERSPWSLVFYRMVDRARGRVRSQSVLLWRGSELIRQFRDPDIRVTPHGRGTPPGALKLPRVMALLAPGTACDVPARLEVLAHDQEDEVRMCFESHALAQVLIPDESNMTGVVALNEVSGRVKVVGQLRGERMEMDGPGVFEFIR